MKGKRKQRERERKGWEKSNNKRGEGERKKSRFDEVVTGGYLATREKKRGLNA